MIKVVQWATGPVGCDAIAAVVDQPDMELVGAYVYSDEKNGRDVGDIAGIGAIGVTATNDRDEILGLDADCVIYMAMGEDNPEPAIKDICDLLASGKNVVSTSVTPLIFPLAMGSEVAQRLENACREGSSSFHGTGIQPGWAAEVLPLTMSGVFRYIESLRMQELLNYASYDHPFNLFEGMGFGRDPEDDTVLWREPSIMGGFFLAPVMLMAEGMGATIDDFAYEREAWVTDRSFDIAAGHIAKGTVAALRFNASAIVDGRKALTVEHVDRVSEDAAPDWPNGRGWKVTIEGLPSMVLEAKIAMHDEDENVQACLGTAMHAVHAIAPLCAADPGIRTFLDLPMIVGRNILQKPEHLTPELARAPLLDH
jgi:hypothetical protein